jgi:uncharacterized protein (TIGR00369 family)
VPSEPAAAERRLHPRIRHEPDPEHPGWWSWDLSDQQDRYNRTLGKLLVRSDGEGLGRCRMFPEVEHSNLGNIVHGGAILTFIDMAMFAGGYMAGADLGPSVTLDLSAQFLSGARLGVPLDCSVELLRESRNMAVMRGMVEQEGQAVAAWSGTLRKLSRR